MPTLTLDLVAETQHGKVEHVLDEKIVILTSKGTFIPFDAFKELLSQVEALVKTTKIEKMIFDKTSLRVFHQPSMEWYHVEWKTRMLPKGLKVYRKILPPDPQFVQRVQVGQEKIRKLYPNFNFDKFDIMYCKRMEDAFNL